MYLRKHTIDWEHYHRLLRCGRNQCISPLLLAPQGEHSPYSVQNNINNMLHKNLNCKIVQYSKNSKYNMTKLQDNTKVFTT